MNRTLILAAMGAAALAVAACTPAEDKAETTDGAMVPADTMAPADGAMAPADGAMAPAEGAMSSEDKMAADKMAMDKMEADRMAADKMAPAQ